MTGSREADQAIHRRHHELAVAVAHALRRAVGLPDEENPFVERHPEESGLPNLGVVASLIVSASHGPGVFGRKPRAIESELESLRRKLRKLREQIESLDHEVRSAINRAGSHEHQHLAELIEAQPESKNEIVAAVDALPRVQRDQWTVPAAIGAMERLEDAIVPVIEKAIGDSARLPQTGRPPGRGKGHVALIVANYIRDVTGVIPQPPSAPWQDTNEPFAVALTEIFGALDLPPGIQRAAEFATSKL